MANSEAIVAALSTDDVPSSVEGELAIDESEFNGEFGPTCLCCSWSVCDCG